MKVVIVEDRPWKMEESIKLMKNKGISIEHIIYVYNKTSFDSEIDDLIKKMESNLNISVKKTDRYSFDDIMNEYYKDKDNLFFCDLNLSGEHKEFFDERINVKYALEIMKKEKGRLNRIWFYTTAGESTNEQINTFFPGRNIAVDRMNNDQVILDIGEVVIALNNYSNY